MTFIPVEPTAPSRFFQQGALDSDLESFRNLWRNNHPLDDLFPDNPFVLDKAVGPLEKNQEPDVAKVQSLLHDAGYLDANRTEGPTGIYSRVLMDESIRAFQVDNGLTPDGVLNPAGPTITKLEEKLRPALNDANGRNVPFALGSTAAGALAGEALFGAEATALGPAALAVGLPVVLWQMHKMAPEMATRRHAAEAEQLRRAGELPRGVETGAFNPPPTPGTPIDPRHLATPGYPSKPPFDPNEEHKNKKPIEPVVVRGTEFPAALEKLPHIYIFPDMSDEIEQISIVENRKGNDRTKAQLDAIRDWIHVHYPQWKHINGGRDRINGREMPEYRVKGPGSAWGADTRPGSNYIDLTFETPSGRLVHIQTVDMDKNGNISDRELRAFKRILDYKADDYPGGDLFLVPKVK
jgi:peptidoglycan hydrolase-like protein with peptidoglycan-binding domain